VRRSKTVATQLEYSRYYTFPEAAAALGVSLEWVDRWVGNAIKQGLIASKNGHDAPVLVSGADLKKVCMKRYAQLETELHWRAFERVRARERGEVIEEEL
jgi:transposase